MFKVGLVDTRRISLALALVAPLTVFDFFFLGTSSSLVSGSTNSTMYGGLSGFLLPLAATMFYKIEKEFVSNRFVPSNCQRFLAQTYLSWKTLLQMLPIQVGITEVDFTNTVGHVGVVSTAGISIAEEYFLQPVRNDKVALHKVTNSLQDCFKVVLLWTSTNQYVERFIYISRFLSIKAIHIGLYKWMLVTEYLSPFTLPYLAYLILIGVKQYADGSGGT